MVDGWFTPELSGPAHGQERQQRIGVVAHEADQVVHALPGQEPFDGLIEAVAARGKDDNDPWRQFAYGPYTRMAELMARVRVEVR